MHLRRSYVVLGSVVVLASVLGIVLVFSVIGGVTKYNEPDLNENVFQASANTTESEINFNHDPSLTLGEPVTKEETLNFPNLGNTTFVAYQDFPVSSDQLSLNGLKIANKPAGSWMKLMISNEEDAKDGSDIRLRIAGVVRPFTPTPFNSSLHVYNIVNDLVDDASIPIVRNGIVSEIAEVRKDFPIRFANELLTQTNASVPRIYGAVYDDRNGGLEGDIQLPNNPVNDKLQIIIEPIGIMRDGKLESMPEWIELRVVNSPLLMEEHVPAYYGIVVSTSNAPAGTYEIALQENIDEKTFIETIMITVPQHWEES